MIGTTPGFDQFSASAPTLATSNTTLMLMDVDEMEDMTDFPYAPNVYWDPFNKCLRLDPQLGKVYVGGEINTLEASISKTTAKRNKRIRQLEEQGFFTRSMIGANSVHHRILYRVIIISSTERLKSEEFDNFRKYGTSSVLSLSMHERERNAEAEEEEYEEAEDGEEEEAINSRDGGGGGGPNRFGSDSSSVLSGKRVMAMRSPLNKDDLFLNGIPGDTYTAGSHKSMVSILALQRTRRQKLEIMRRKTIDMAAEFGMYIFLSCFFTLFGEYFCHFVLPRKQNLVPWILL